MNTERIEDLIMILEKDKIKDVEYDGKTFGRKGPCGQTACALGHASLFPKFQKAGLKHRWIDCGYGESKLIIEFGRYDNLWAASDFFGIDYDLADIVFGRANNTKEDVIFFLKEALEQGEEYVIDNY